MDIKRKAIIINNDRNPGDKDILKGNMVDVERFRTYLKTSWGGAWLDDEIYVPPTNFFTKETLVKYIEETIKGEGINFWVVVFTGHGATSDDGKQKRTIVQLSPGNICEVDCVITALSSCRAFLIIDSCRTLVPITEGRAPIPALIPDYGNQDYRNECRRLYDIEVALMPEKSQYIAYSCMEGQEAKSTSAFGSLYLYILLHSASVLAQQNYTSRNIQFTNARAHIIPFKQIHDIANCEVFQISKGTQTPEYVGSDNYPPFIVTPGFI